MTFAQINQIIKAEIDLRPMGITRMYTFVVSEIFKGDASAAEKFLLDPKFGGYTTDEVNFAKRTSKVFKSAVLIKKINK